MKLRILTLLLCACCYTKAADTLTRAEIYDFAIGDTFDYWQHSMQGFRVNGQFNYTHTYGVKRYVVTNIFRSQDTLTKYIVRTRLYPLPLTADTLVLNNLDGYEVIMDTALSTSPNFPSTINIDSSTSFWGRETNTGEYFCCAPGYEKMIFAKGLGLILSNRHGGALSFSFSDSLLLVYYSGSQGTFGTPYTSLSIPTGIDDITSAENDVRVSLANDVLTITTTGLPQSIHFELYDLQGRLVNEIAANEPREEIPTNNMDRGVYIWKASSSNFNQSGKIVLR